MSLYTRARKHIDMDRVKELREEKIEQKKVTNEIREQIRDELLNINSPEFSNWRYDLDENMTTSDLFSTTLPATGDAINFTINSAESDAYNLITTSDSGSWVNLTGSTGATRQSFDYGTGNGAFPGTIDSALYFAVPFNGDHSGTVDYFYATTRSFEVKNNSLTFSAIAGNSSSNLGGGLGSNGGTLPYRDLSVYWISYNDDGTIDDLDLLGTIPKTTSSLTNFAFDIPTKLFGKTISLNYYSDTNAGANYQMSWLNGENVSFHPNALDGDVKYTSEVVWSILNYNELDANAYYKQFAKTTLAYVLWVDLQQLYTGDNDWGDNDNNSLGFPAPVSGGRTGLDKGSSPMSMADLNSIVSTIESQFSSKKGLNTTMYALGNVNFQRKTPMDEPEATNFIRTDPIMKGLSSGERKKKLEDMLDAGDEYLLKYLGMTQFSARPAETALVEPFKKDIVDWQGRWASQESGVRGWQGTRSQPVRTTRTIETPTGSSTETPTGSSTETPTGSSTVADKLGLPPDYKDKLRDANAYFHNNLKFLPQRAEGTPKRMDDLMKKAYQRQGFTKDQIDTIEREQLVRNNYGPSPTYKPEPEPKSSNNSSGLTNAELAALAKRDGLPYYGTAGSDASKSSPKNTSTSDPFMNIRVGNTSKTSSGVKDYGNIAAAGVPRNTGGSSSGDPNNIQWPRDKYPNKKAPPGPGARTANVPGTTDYGNVAATYGGKEAENKQKIKNMLNDPKDPFYQAPSKPGQPGKGRGMGDRWLPLAKKKQKAMVAHHEPKGKVLSEKKRLKSPKDITSKIPGYYDGKPAPLGFPMQEPPKMVNGFHPDLVDGKKIANRFNRLDPQSAKAMPPTGNPHIDKKVRAAAKKPK